MAILQKVLKDKELDPENLMHQSRIYPVSPKSGQLALKKTHVELSQEKRFLE